ncbi:MAG: non-ribosomal peptide synthetase [Alphaproteobacteria bacterium]|nr:non-ribosomal peptide synthetase [Alphaproteobacteria bacterium]
MRERIPTEPSGERLLRLVGADGPTSPTRITRPGGLVAAIEGLAREDPDRMAVVTADGRATYGAMAALAVALARRIGVATAAPVLAVGQTGLMQVVAMIACQRTGRPLVPVDPGTSPLRLRQVAMSSGADVLVRHAHDPPAIDALRDDRMRTIIFETLAPSPAPVPERIGDAAFIVFTSGSTGVPKGVCHSPASLASSVGLECEILAIRSGDRVALVTPAATVSGPVFTMAPLAVGATLLLLPERVAIGALMEMLERERATHLLCYVGLARAAAAHPRGDAAFRHLRSVQIYGDVVRQDDCAMLRAVLPPQARIHLLYGSTEASMTAACVAEPGMAITDGRMPLGRPLPGVEVWLRTSPDAGADPDVGEISVAGARVVRGYWRARGADEDRFERHPHDPDRVLFRVGDLARLRPDGLLELVGRVDNQVKLRGWRIELEDVETVARGVPGVDAACVVPRRDAEGIVEALALHVAARDPDGSLRRRLDAALHDALPGHMVPAPIVVGPALPLTGTGKVDRLRLAEIDRRLRDARPDGGPGAPPAERAWPDPLSSRIAAAIAEEAGIAGLCPDDNLNALGMDSLQAVNVALRIEKQWDVAIEPAELLDERPLREVVAAIVSLARAT